VTYYPNIEEVICSARFAGSPGVRDLAASRKTAGGAAVVRTIDFSGPTGIMDR